MDMVLTVTVLPVLFDKVSYGLDPGVLIVIGVAQVIFIIVVFVT